MELSRRVKKYSRIFNFLLFYNYINRTFCRSPYDYGVPFDESEKDIIEFNFGFTNFDNFINAMFTVFHMVRTTGWSSITFIVNIYFLNK